MMMMIEEGGDAGTCVSGELNLAIYVYMAAQ